MLRWPVLLALPVAALLAQSQWFVNAQLPYHSPVLDRQGKLLAWYEPGKNLGYDRVLRLGWDFIEHKVPVDTRTKTGLKIYLINSVFDDNTLQGVYWQHNPAMVYAAFVDGLVAWYPYSGDEEAIAAVRETGLPPATVQMIYNLAPEDGLRLAADPRLGAVGFTGSRAAGMKLKAAADAVGKPVYLEMSSLNPVVILPGALLERGAKIVEEFTGSCLMANGQFCTSPGLTILIDGDASEQFIAGVKAKFESSTPGTLLSSGVGKNLAASVITLQIAGAELVTGGSPLAGNKFANTLLRVSGKQFLASPEKLQTEAFGNASLVVVARDAAEVENILAYLEGNLTGGIYSDTNGGDETLYEKFAPLLRSRVGRLLNDKMPTGVAVSPAMNHGGPFPATGHPGFTAVGIPGSLRRFAALHCYDNVRPARLPAALKNANPNGRMWRLIDGNWSQGDVSA